MFKELIDAAVASLLEPYAEEIRKLKSENETLLRRVTALEARPDPFDVRKYIDDCIREIGIRAEAPSPEDVAEAINEKKLRKALEYVDIDAKLQEAVQEWCCEQDWTEEANYAFKEWAYENDLSADIANKIAGRIKVTVDED